MVIFSFRFALYFRLVDIIFILGLKQYIEFSLNPKNLDLHLSACFLVQEVTKEIK